MVTKGERNRHDPFTVRAAVAGGHPATVEAGVEILAEGGSAADAAVAAALASCVAETVMTGLLGGGHAVYYDAATGRVRNLDCFVAVPGIGAESRGDAELVHYAVGPASCGVPGLPAGLGLLHAEHGRLPWPRLVEPALRLARNGVVFPAAHAACLAMLAPVMTMDEGARIYSPGGRLLQAGETLRQPGLTTALEMLADEGAGSLYEGSLADALLGLMDARGGLVTRADLLGYEASWSQPAEYAYDGRVVLTRAGLAPVGDALERLPPLRERSGPDRAVTLARTLAAVEGEGDTTNLVTVDGDGNACSLTTSLGLGSGDFVPGLDLHLNSMLGEADLIRGPLEAGQRMESMMSPLLILDGKGLALAGGAAGGTRLRSALVQVVAGILDEGLEPGDAVARPRLHPAPELVHVEPGLGDDVVRALEAQGLDVREWPERHHYFGGVSVVTRSGAAGDPRRSGAAATLPG
jgi:gamma-glutamyltranspeptidase / glutathione hydrolase